MLILLPPSEGKSAARTGAPLHLDDLHFPDLNDARRAVLDALRAASAADDAHAVLGVGASLAEDVARNLVLDVAPAAPAHDIYSGVLYDALDYAGMTAAQRRKAREQCVVVSALWGAVGFGDRIPAYRLSMGAELPGLGRLAAHWKHHLPAVLEPAAGDGLVVDCRSAAYAAAWRGPRARTVGVKAVRERNGRRQVVSHMAKHTRGLLARHLVERAAAGERLETPLDLLSAAQERWRAELTEPTARSAGELVVVLTED